ncbi:MAG TPA: GNAT family N-acetyltransferase [Chloroflexota bacterium]|nr:GNAT family N-acetyltransferase [Chloroflexota bacterium]
MPSPTRPLRDLDFHPVTADRLGDLARFSACHGTFRWCSCMRWRLSSTDFRCSTPESRAARLEELVHQGTPVGVLAYLDGEPVGWCSIAPRETYVALERSRTIPRLDDTPAWSVACFFVAAAVRRRGVTLGLLDAAVAYAQAQGARVIEGYPVEHGASYSWMGSPAIFELAGFREIEWPVHGRRLMRYVVSPGEQISAERADR